MSYLKKSIILSNKSRGITYGMAVLTIEKNNGGVYGTFVSHDYNGPGLTLGISVQGRQVVKLDVVFDKYNTYYFKLPVDFDINGTIGAVLVRIDDGQVAPVLWGASAMRAEVREDIISSIEDDIQPLQAEINATQHDVDTLSNQVNLFTPDDNMDKLIEDEVDKAIEDSDNFYMLIKDQLDELFSSYEPYDDLSNIIPGSKWVRVDFDGNGKEYVVGKIYDDDDLKYICYGVPSKADVDPPARLAKYSQWLPLNDDEGYWIMYQDASTGEAKEVG